MHHGTRGLTLERVVDTGLCIGCGLCQSVAGADRVRLMLHGEGGERPQVLTPLDADTERRILAVCPGVRVEAPDGSSGRARPARDGAPARHPIWGLAERVALGHAADPGVRFEAASGGVLSALAIFLIESGKVEFVLHVAASAELPLRSDAQSSFTPAQVMGGARSRYGPAAPLVDFCSLLEGGRRFAFVGKPCDVAAVRNLARLDPRVNELVPYLLTMFCGGVSELSLSLDFLRGRDLALEQVRLFRYRGYGCPGPTRVETHNGRVFETTYNDFWGADESTWRLQFRCKICPDSIGEQADIAALDAWPGGSPTDEDEGFNAVVARTPRGAALLAEAAAAGAVRVVRELNLTDLDGLQPHQERRRRAIAPRLAGFALASGVVPRFRGYRLVRAARKVGIAASLPEFLGAVRRARALRRE